MVLADFAIKGLTLLFVDVFLDQRDELEERADRDALHFKAGLVLQSRIAAQNAKAVRGVSSR